MNRGVHADCHSTASPRMMFRRRPAVALLKAALNAALLVTRGSDPWSVTRSAQVARRRAMRSLP